MLDSLVKLSCSVLVSSIRTFAAYLAWRTLSSDLRPFKWYIHGRSFMISRRDDLGWWAIALEWVYGFNMVYSESLLLLKFLAPFLWMNGW
jgi:hypothetical protein